MNQNQKRVLMLALIAIACMGIFPPWLTIGEKADLGYWWITNPPEYGEYFTGKIDLVRLIVQWIVSSAIAVGMFIHFQGNKTK